MLIKEQIKKFFAKKWDMQGSEIFSKIFPSYSPTGKVVFLIFFLVFLFSSAILLNDVNKYFIVQVPVQGGTLIEGLVGAPRFINPLLATADTDKDISYLIYSGLMKPTTNGGVIPDLAKSYKISKDETEYTFTLKDNLYFQDGVKLTTDDILFTIEKSQDPNLKSPKRPSFYNIKIEKLNDKEIKFILPKPYGTFLENLTIGILPKHIWENMDNNQFSLSPYNLEPVGSGPYKIAKADTIKKGLSFSSIYYDLIPFNRYIGEKAKIAKLTFKFYQTEDAIVNAYNSGDIESLSISAERIKDLKLKNEVIETLPTSKIFALFFNQNQAPIFANKEIRKVLLGITDTHEIITKTLGGYGNPIMGPLSVDMNTAPSMTTEDAIKLLEKNGWKMNKTTKIYEKTVNKVVQQLSFSISTGNTQRFLSAVEILKNQWEKIGAKVEIKSFEQGDIQQNVIAVRKYDSLFFGEATGRDLDMFPFWHSSQRVDGYNVAMYTNSKADKIIEDARATLDRTARATKYKQLENELESDIPAIFIYSPEYIYITSNKIKGSSFGRIIVSSDRFISIPSWYIETDGVWKIFVK
ncbi:MAG: ABC transporter substrate-binding protein [Minisyncoccia bacterium]